MRLSSLLSGVGININREDVEISGISSDSRQIKQGYVFCALSQHANKFIDQAIAQGAVAVITGGDVQDVNVIHIKSDDSRRLYSKIASVFYKKQPQNIVAVTGTNGKTSVVNFCQQLWGQKSVSIGSLGVIGDVSKKYDISLTTPDAIDMHYILNDVAQDGVNYAAIEASSHGLDQDRLHNVKVIAAGFTNLSQDHYDYHKSASSYFNAKKKLFLEVLDLDGIAVINSDIPEYQSLSECNRTIITYGKNANHIKILKQIPQDNGQIILFDFCGNKRETFVPIMGKFQIYNILCAIGLVHASGYEEINLNNLQPIKGRMEIINGENFKVVVDYAHTPDALQSALISLRWHMNRGRIILVFGCGGNRDNAKRILMGEISNFYADFVIICDDNPRDEDASKIRKEIISNCPKAVEIGDRKQAIITAINEAKKNDVILIAGKGHETTQIVKGRVLECNDALIVKNIFNAVNN